MSIDLYYWPMVPGRGEYPRLVLEVANVPYRDVCRLPDSEGGGIDAMMAIMKGRSGARPAFAPPFLIDEGTLVSQSAEISAYVGERHGLAPAGESDRLFARSVALTIADLVDEAHDVHHPLGSDLYYEDQKDEALRRAKGFRTARLPKFLGWFETLLKDNPAKSGFLVGETMTYADLALFHTMAGLHYAFPKRMAAIETDYEHIAALVTLVGMDARLTAYLASERRLPFDENGIFRHYPELDAE